MIFYLGLFTVAILTLALLLGLQGVKRRYCVPCHPRGRHGLAYKPGMAVTRGTRAAELGLAIPAPPPQPAMVKWEVVEQKVIGR